MNAESIFTQRSFSLIHMGHDHGLTAGARHRGRLVAVLCLSLSILAIEAVAAWLTSSLALLADAGHVLGDSLGIIMALAAITVAQARSEERRVGRAVDREDGGVSERRD